MKNQAMIFTMFVVSAMIIFACSVVTGATTSQSATQPPAQPPTSDTGTGSLGRRTKTSGCVSQNALPDPDCTPGAIFPDATVDKICVPGYSSNVRNVPESEKNQVYAEYGVKSHTAGQYEVDHLISLELGGSNSIANLWPEPAEPRPGFHEKDKVENYLHDQVCSGAISLQQAQYEIAHDWMSVYQSMPDK
ncbi:MAG: HNH endonuclease [Chloroflexi bacterium]|nr:HNH endonuclease [Chloroflexota bacterium]